MSLSVVESREITGWLTNIAWIAGAQRAPLQMLSHFAERVRIDNFDEDGASRYLGVMSDIMAWALLEVLESLTSTPQHCYFAVWVGYVPSDPTVLEYALPVGLQDYVVLAGPIGAGRELGEWLPGQTPNFAWPEDRHWCWITDIDLPVTYVGGPTGIGECLKRRVELDSVTQVVNVAPD